MSESSSTGVRRPLLTGLAVAGLLAASALGAAAPSASAATTTLYVSPSGSGSSCSSSQPCSISGAQTAVRAQAPTMSDDIVVELADGTYRLSEPLRLTAADSGTNGHTVSWRAAGSARPVVTGARAVTGWTLANQSKNIWQASVGSGFDTRQLYVDGVPAIRARSTLNRSDFTMTTSGMRFSNSSLNYLNSLANQSRIELESVGSFTDRYVPVQSISGNFITMQQPAWNNNTFGYDTFSKPHRAGSLFLENAYELLDSAGEWYLNPGTGILSYIPRSGQSMSSAQVELPRLQSLVSIGGTYNAPAHDISFSGITFTGTSWLGPSSNQGFADQQTGAYIYGNWDRPGDALTSCQEGCKLFEATRPNWQQMPAAVQVSAANAISFDNDQFVNVGQTALGIGNDANAHTSGVGLGASAVSVTRSTFARGSAGAIVVGGVRADAHHPSDTRMTNRNITVSNNSIHDMGLDYRGITSVLTTYVATASIANNEIYNMPYSGMGIGYGWGANDAGGATEYANRGLYSYQPRYTTATTASNVQVTGNYIHDVMQQMTDGSCIYTLSANPSSQINRNYCLRTNGWFGLYFDEGSRYYSADNNVFSSVGSWATSNYYNNVNTGDQRVTNNWATNNQTNLGDGNRRNTLSGNVYVTNGNWPSGAQSVMSSAGIQPRTTPTTTSPVPTTTRPVPTTTSPVPTTTTAVPTTTSAVPTTTTAGTGKACSATYSLVGQWGGGFQADVKVTAGSSPITAWKVTWTLGSGQAVTQSWGTTLTTSGSNVSAANVDYNGSLGAGASTNFGFIGSATGTPSIPTVTCTAG